MSGDSEANLFGTFDVSSSLYIFPEYASLLVAFPTGPIRARHLVFQAVSTEPQPKYTG